MKGGCRSHLEAPAAELLDEGMYVGACNYVFLGAGYESTYVVVARNKDHGSEDDFKATKRSLCLFRHGNALLLGSLCHRCSGS